jgi:hypothetical protein
MAWIDSGYVFTRKDGQPINPSYANHTRGARALDQPLTAVTVQALTDAPLGLD